MQLRITLGALLFIVIIAVLGYVIVNEGALPGQTGRMQKFDASVQARSIEAGALLFQNNCIGCHGVQGQGIPVLGLHSTLQICSRRPAQEANYTAKVEDYIRGTISAGRPIKSKPGLSQPDADVGPGLRRSHARGSGQQSD